MKGEPEARTVFEGREEEEGGQEMPKTEGTTEVVPTDGNKMFFAGTDPAAWARCANHIDHLRRSGAGGDWLIGQEKGRLVLRPA